MEQSWIGETLGLAILEVDINLRKESLQEKESELQEESHSKKEVGFKKKVSSKKKVCLIQLQSLS